MSHDDTRAEGMSSDLEYWNLESRYETTPWGELIFFIDGILHAVTGKQLDPKTGQYLPLWTHATVTPTSIAQREIRCKTGKLIFAEVILR